MKNRRKIAAVFLMLLSCQALWGGAGRPSDGLLSFFLLLGFLLAILGILQLFDLLKKRMDHLLDGMY